MSNKKSSMETIIETHQNPEKMKLVINVQEIVSARTDERTSFQIFNIEPESGKDIEFKKIGALPSRYAGLNQ